jgi:GNAT superfamily N-acetyltransferase
LGARLRDRQTELRVCLILGRQLEEPNVVALVAERDGEVIGYTYAGVEGHDYRALRGPAGVLHDVVVDPAHRGHGIGRMLLDATLAALAVLSTAEQNESAKRLLLARGSGGRCSR